MNSLIAQLSQETSCSTKPNVCFLNHFRFESQAVAYAGFWKGGGGGAEIQKI